MAVKHGKMVTYLEGLPLTKSHDFKTRDRVRSLDKLKTLNFHYHNNYGHRTSQGDEITKRAPTHKVA